MSGVQEALAVEALVTGLHADLTAKATKRDGGPITRSTYYALYAQAYARASREATLADLINTEGT